MIRQPIISVLGHVDSGKTTLLDYIRGSLVAERESGGITQMIGSTQVPLDKIEEICGDLLQQLDTELRIPGLLFIDTPGHAAFTSLRKRGGSLSDIAVVVVGVSSGVQPQTREAIEILRESGTPFVIALNKVDTIPGWQDNEGGSFLQNYQQQGDRVQKRLDEIIYELMGDFSDMDFTVDRYDKVDDFTKKVGVVPISAKTGEGIPDLLMTMAGLSQRYLADRLEVHPGIGKGTVLEVNEVKGFGTTIDIILYDGAIHKDDTLVVGSGDDPIITNIKALLEPNPLREIRTESDFRSIDEVSAAAGVKISAPDLDNVVAGVPLRSLSADADETVEEATDAVTAEMASFTIETQTNGVIVRADSLGSLEAILDFISDKDIAVKKAAVGKVTKKDIIEAEHEEDTNRAILAFNTSLADTAEEQLQDADIQYFESDIIYQLIEEYEEWTEKLDQQQRQQVLENITRPAKIRIMPDHVFRSSNPAVVGVEIRDGVLNTGSALMNENGESRGRVKSIQEDGDSINSATKGQEVAVSITDITMGRQVEEGDELYTNIPSKDYKIIQRMEDEFSQGELQLLEEIVEIKDNVDPRWKLG